MKFCLFLSLVLLGISPLAARETLPPLVGDKTPQSLDELWGNFDPRAEALEVEVCKEWEQEGVVCRVIRYTVGVFKGAPVRMAAFYAVPKTSPDAAAGGSSKVPALLHLHGGGQSAHLENVVTDARRGYASLSLNWGGNAMRLGKGAIYDGPNTDWGLLDATHPPQRNSVNHFAGGIAPDSFTLDPVVSARNDNWFLVVLAARRALTFLEQQPEIDPARLGVYGHSMGGRLTTQLTGIDKRVKAAVPSCGGSGDVLESEIPVQGGTRSKRPPVEMACVSENPYIERLTVPTLWLSPTNDFHAIIDNMAHTWRNVPDTLLGLSISPHFNHRHTDESLITQHLWFEQHLKGAFRLPKAPKLELVLVTPGHVPSVSVVPDGSQPVEGVDVYFSTDPHTLTRFWRDAGAEKDGPRWKAVLPVMSVEQPLFVYANVRYSTPPQYRDLPVVPGQSNTPAFTISSRVATASPGQLVKAGIVPKDKRDRLIDDGSRGWHDWYKLNWRNPTLWTAATRKLKDPKWRGPDGARLLFEVNPKTDCTLFVRVVSNDWSAFSREPRREYAVRKELQGGADWQTISVGLEELVPLDPKVEGTLPNWHTVTELMFSPSSESGRKGEGSRIEGKAWKGSVEPQFRNLRWEGGVYPEVSSKDSVPTAGTQEKAFNEAIKRSLEQEKLDRK